MKKIGLIIIILGIAWVGYAVKSIEVQTHNYHNRVEAFMEPGDPEYHDYAPYYECGSDWDCEQMFGGAY